MTLSNRRFAFKGEFLLWKGKLEWGGTAAFLSLNDYVQDWEDNDIRVLKAIKPILVNHLGNLITKFNGDIPDRYLTSQHWVSNQFQAMADSQSEDAH